MLKNLENKVVENGLLHNRRLWEIQNRVMCIRRTIILQLIVAVIEEMDVWLQFVWIQVGNIMLREIENKVEKRND